MSTRHPGQRQFLRGRLSPQMEALGKPSILAAAAAAIIAIVIVNPYSVLNFVYYLIIWSAYIFAFHRDELPLFVKAFIVNSVFIGIFFIVQTNVYPTSFGTTSQLSPLWTDDSFFFSLAADSVPPGMEVRDYYFLYTEIYPSVIRAVTLLPINHPMDAIFFQSGIAALLSTFSRRYALQVTQDLRVGNATYYLTMLCPFLMMNGGVILVRDTFAAALFIYSLSCINDRRWILAMGAIALNFALRPGTAIILVPAYFILNLAGMWGVSKERAALIGIALPITILAAVGFVVLFVDVSRYQNYLDYMSLGGRDFTSELTTDPSGNQILLSIQQMSFGVKFILNGMYMFTYPFLSLNGAFGGFYFDLRSITMDFVFPIMAFWFNGWFVAGAITRIKVGDAHRMIVLAFAVTILIIGTYSLQSRHKTIAQPLYYLVAAIGLTRARPGERQVGYACSGALLLLEIAISLR